jgi:hypothetical protein
MQAKCLASGLTDEQREATNASARFRPRYQVTEGRGYLVLGLSFVLNSPVYGNCCLFTIQDDADRCILVPSLLFEITDPRSSRFWIARDFGASNFTLWPEEFYDEFFHDRATDGDAQAVAVVRSVSGRLYEEMQHAAMGTLGSGFRDGHQNE